MFSYPDPQQGHFQGLSKAWEGEYPPFPQYPEALSFLSAHTPHRVTRRPARRVPDSEKHER